MPKFNVTATRHHHITMTVEAVIEAPSLEQAKKRMTELSEDYDANFGHQNELETMDWKERKETEDIGNMHNLITDVEVYYTPTSALQTLTKVR